MTDVAAPTIMPVAPSRSGLIRRSAERGYAEHGWLKSFHSFSFGEYFDPRHHQFGPLRVINEDWIAPGTGFGTHGHRDMEIITYVLEGELAHKDSMANGDHASVIRPGDVQRMSAGRGVLHSEYNHSQNQTTHLLQIWILPNVSGIVPSYEEKRFDAHEKRGRLRLIASGDAAEASVLIHQDARLYAGLFDGNEAATLTLAPERKVYVHVARGTLTVNGASLNAGDAWMGSDAPSVSFSQGQGSEVLVFDLAA